MTLQDIETLDREYLTPEDVAGVLGCDRYAINVQAKADPSRLGFAVYMMGTRVRIPRRAFLRWMKYGNAPVQEGET